MSDDMLVAVLFVGGILGFGCLMYWLPGWYWARWERRYDQERAAELAACPDDGGPMTLRKRLTAAEIAVVQRCAASAGVSPAAAADILDSPYTPPDEGCAEGRCG